MLTDFENTPVMELIDCVGTQEDDYGSFGIRISNIYSLYLVSNTYRGHLVTPEASKALLKSCLNGRSESECSYAIES